MNILLTSVGRRSYLVEYFNEALGDDGKVYGANSDTETSAMKVVDKAFKVPYVNSDDYIPTLLNICKENDVKLIVSLFDIDLPYLATAKEKFEEQGIRIVVSDKEIVEIANDKFKTYEFLCEHYIDTPFTCKSIDEFKIAMADKKISYPVIVKPRWGMGSISLFKADNEEELEFFVNYTKKQIKESYLSILTGNELEESVLIQEFISGKEYGIDIFNDFNSKHLVTVVKEKLAMRSGETDGAIVVENKEVENLANRVGDALKHIGNLDIDILMDAKTQKPYVLEFNARFGGGYPFSHIAGVNFPKLLIQMAKNEKIDTNLIKFKSGTKSLKFIEPKVVI